MPIQKCFFISLKALKTFILLAAIAHHHPVRGLESGNLDEATGDQGIKCTPSCVQTPPPPPPPPTPSPPPPSPPPPPVLPPPTPPSPPKKPPKQYCPPPPPPSSFIYITGPPGNLYPIDTDVNGTASKTIPPSMPLLVASGILGLLAFW